MKRIINLCIILTVCFLLTSCGKIVNTNPTETETGSTGANEPIAGESIQVNSAGNYGVYDMTGAFINKVNDNPLDRDYQAELRKLNESKDFSTLTMIELESKYTTLWDVELNVIYKKLLAKLNPLEKEGLIESQKGWLQYHLKESEFINQVFYLRESGQIFGSQGKVQIQQAIKGRLRERTLELLEYDSLLGNDVEFEYKGIKN